MCHMHEVIVKCGASQDACKLPDHSVIKSSRITTKNRVVFDDSAETSTGAALKDVLKRGLTIQKHFFHSDKISETSICIDRRH